MPAPVTRFVRLFAVCCLVLAGCGTKPTEGASATKSADATVATAKTPESSGNDGASSGGGTWDCTYYPGGGVDYQSQSAAYLFIGDHPMCTDPDKVKDFCATLTKREGFVRAQSDNAAAEGLREVAASLPEESRQGYLAQHPLHGLEQAMAKCGLKLDQVRAQLIAEAEASINSGAADQAESTGFLMAEAPAKAEAIWTRECAGHMDQKTVGEGLDWDFKGKPTYKGFCTSTSDPSTKPVKFKAPAAH